MYMIMLQQRHTLFPYTTLFRSRTWPLHLLNCSAPDGYTAVCSSNSESRITRSSIGSPSNSGLDSMSSPVRRRSEEHTSELQSRGHLVCRILLEKKKEGVARNTS